MRVRWWCGCWGGGRWWYWGGWCWGGRLIPRPGSTLCASLHSRNVHGHFTRAIWKFAGKVPYAKPATPVLCEAAQSKCTRTCHKRHFVRKFRGKMPNAPDTTSIEHRALTPTVGTPSVWTHCLGKKERRKGFWRTTTTNKYLSLI